MNFPSLTHLSPAARFNAIKQAVQYVIPEPQYHDARYTDQQLIDSRTLAGMVERIYTGSLSETMAKLLLQAKHFEDANHAEKHVLRHLAAVENGEMQWRYRMNAAAYFLRTWNASKN